MIRFDRPFGPFGGEWLVWRSGPLWAACLYDPETIYAQLSVMAMTMLSQLRRGV